MAPPVGDLRESRADYAICRGDGDLKWGGRCATSRQKGQDVVWLAAGRRLGEVHVRQLVILAFGLAILDDRRMTERNSNGADFDVPPFVPPSSGAGGKSWGKEGTEPLSTGKQCQEEPRRSWATTCRFGGVSRSKVVGAPGFEPETSCAQGRRATRLRYAPTTSGIP